MLIKILVVDDSTAERALICKALDMYCILTADSGTKALRLLASTGTSAGDTRHRNAGHGRFPVLETLKGRTAQQTARYHTFCSR